MFKLFGGKKSNDDGKAKRARFFGGRAFAFIIPNENATVAFVDAQGNVKENREVNEPSIFSTLNSAVVYNKYTVAKTDLAALTLFSITTDRRIYKKKETAKVLIAGLDCASLVVKLDVKRNDQLVFQEEVKLDALGTAISAIPDLDEGAYKLEAKVEKNAGAVYAEAEFSVADFTLSPLEAVLDSFKVDCGNLTAKVSLTSLNRPYSGNVEVGLWCKYCNVVVERAEVGFTDGCGTVKIPISSHTGPFTLEFSTDEGNTATIFLQGTRSEEREELIISRLGKNFAASLAPYEGAECSHDIYYRITGTSVAPFELDDVIAKRASITVTKDFDVVQAVAYSPVTKKMESVTSKCVKKGTKIEVDILPPYSIIMLGAISSERVEAYEDHAVVLAKGSMDANVEVQQNAKPGETIKIKLTSASKAKCMVVVGDQRLEHENLNKKLAKSMFSNMKANMPMLQSGPAEDLEMLEFKRQNTIEKDRLYSRRMGIQEGGAPLSARPRMREMDFENTSVKKADAKLMMSGLVADSDGAAIIVNKPPTSTASAQAIREELAIPRADFPEMLLCETFDIEGTFEKEVKLGDSIGQWKVLAYFYNGLDFSEVTRRITADKDAFVELDIPSMLMEGDKVSAKVLFKAPVATDENGNKRTPVSTLEVIQGEHIIQKTVEGTGVEHIELLGPCKVVARISTPVGNDEVIREIFEPGIEVLQTSELVMLEAGDRCDGFKAAVVYPSMGELIKESVGCLLNYPHGCAEQTSSKMCGLAILYGGIREGSIAGNEAETKKMMYSGINRMKLFFNKDKKMFSLWENGVPDISTTEKVLANLIPYARLDRTDAMVNDIRTMIDLCVETLLHEKVKNNALIELNSAFKRAIETVEDASALICSNASKKDKQEAVEFIVKNAKEEGEALYWTGRAWGGALESTCEALKGLAGIEEHKGLFARGFAYVASKLVDGRLYSTSDTKAMIDLFTRMKLKGAGKIKVNGETVVPNGAMLLKEPFEADGSVMVRIDNESKVDILSKSSNFDFDIEVADAKGNKLTGLSLGERVNIRLTPREKTRCPLVKVYLPATIAALKGGANVQTINMPVTSGSVTIEAIAVRTGKAGLYVVMYDMYDSTKIGISSRLEFEVSAR